MRFHVNGRCFVLDRIDLLSRQISVETKSNDMCCYASSAEADMRATSQSKQDATGPARRS